jgi:hypothetical protein
MPWGRVDDTFHGHPKVRKAWRERGALGLWVLGLSWSMSYGTDGRIDTEYVEDQLPDAGERAACVAALERVGLWERRDGGWQMHDFADCNPLVADIEARREADRERKRDS